MTPDLRTGHAASVKRLAPRVARRLYVHVEHRIEVRDWSQFQSSLCLVLAVPLLFLTILTILDCVDAPRNRLSHFGVGLFFIKGRAG